MKIKELENKLNEKEKGCDFSLHRVSRFIQPSILLFLSREPSYGYELIEKLKSLGFHEESIDVGAVYRTLRRLEKEGFVKSSWQIKERRKKRVYKITPNGRVLLRIWVERIKERKEALEKFIKFYQGGKL
ncbi:MAG: helix-turn-helix transcriptional regulator [Candidatus Omnitrophica bacterium]|nr:helix-turn-helix transcriptional regulator [Candidatus Omnitrophota bacterium]